MDRKRAMIMLNRNKRYLSYGVYLTIKGQIEHGQIQAAQRGLRRLQKRRIGGGQVVQVVV